MPPAATAGPGAAAQPCLRTHEKEVAWLHLVDWIVLLLVAMYGVLSLVQPFHRFVAGDMMATLRYPMKDNTVPGWAVPVIAIVVPMVFIIGVYVKRRNVYDLDRDLHHAILGLLFSVLITAILTVVVKDAVGRPRPDFFWLCFPDGVPNYNNITGDVVCHGDPRVIKQGYKSFPSGHASGCFAGLGFLSWYLAGKIKAFDRRGHVAKLCIVLLPLLLASMVAVSRVSDYWHHWQDVFAGGLLGLVVASFCFLQFFPLPYSEHGFWPHAYLEHIRRPACESQVLSATNSNMHHQSLSLHLSGTSELRTSSQALGSMEEGSRDQ